MRKLMLFAPPGMNLNGWRNFTWVTMVGSSLFSLGTFLYGLFSALQKLYDPRTHELLENVQSLDFRHMLGIGVKGFPIFSVSMVVFVAENYLSFFQESKSIYTMARIKSPLELHIRCWTLPLISAAGLMVCKWILTVLYFIISILATPKGVPVPQWSQLIWGLLL